MAQFTACVSIATLLFAISVQGASKAPLPLPSFMKACHRSDPNFKECSLKSGREALPYMFDGVPKYRIPVLDPVKIEKLEIDELNGPVGLAVTATDCDIVGARKARLDVVDINLKTGHVELEFYIPRLEALCFYNATGKILLLPIQGSGPGNLTLTDLYLKYSYEYKPEIRKGIEYYIPDRSTVKLDYNTTRLYTRLENLFNGDKLLGETTNDALNENWKDLLKTVGPIVAETVGEVAHTILTAVCELVPQAEAFPE